MVLQIKDERRIGIILTYVSLFLQVVTAFFVTPRILKILGQGEYGVYQLATSTISYLNLIGLGFSSSYIRFYSRYNLYSEEDAIARLNGMFLAIFMIMSTFCIAVGLVMVKNIEILYDTGLSTGEYLIARKLMIVLTFNMSLTFPKSLFTSYIVAHERFAFQKGLVVLNSVLSPVFQIIILKVGFRSIGLAVVVLAMSMVDLLVLCFYCCRKLKIKIVFVKFNKQLLGEIWSFTFFIFLNQIFDTLGGSNVDNFLIGRFKGSMSVAIYSVGSQINQLYYILSSPFSAVYVPEINRIVAKGKSDKKLSDIFLKIGRYQLIVLVLVLTGFIIWGKDFIVYWVGDGYLESYKIAIVLMLPVTVALSQNVGIEIQRAKNKHQVRSIVYLVIEVLNVIISIPLVLKFDAIGAAYGTAVTLMLGTVVFMNIYYQKALDIDIKKYWINFMKHIVCTFPCFVFGMLIRHYFPITGLANMIIQIFMYTVLYCIICFRLILSKNERKAIIDLFNNGRK